jgi:hypothetical protein
MHDGPVIPHAAPQTDQDGPFAAAVKKRHHFRPQFIQGSLRSMLERHVPVMDPAVGDVPENAADSGQADPLRQHPAEILAVFQVSENLLEQVLGFIVPDIGNDSGCIDDAVYGT